MEAKEQLEKMKEAAEKDVSRLESDSRSAKARLQTFNEAVEVSQAAPLAVLRKLQEKARREQSVIEEIEVQIVNAKGRVSALEEAIKLFPKDGEGAELRAGSQMAEVREVLRAHGKAMSLTEILKAIGAEGDESKRNSLRGSLASYARDGRVFERGEGAEMFGLIEFKSPTKDPDEN
ncbi:MAG: hypothetical protein AAB676_02465 [Verrucomicrobiota bacterium]